MLLFVSPSNPTGAVYPPEAGRGRSAGGPRRTACGWSPTRSTSTWSTAARGSSSMPVRRRRLADRCVVLNGVAKTYAMTGWRVGWMIGPDDVIKAAANLQSPRHLQRLQRGPAAALAARDRRPVRGRRDAGGVRPAPADHGQDAERDPRRDLPRAAGRLLLLPVGQGPARQGDRAASGRRRRPSWPG